MLFFSLACGWLPVEEDVCVVYVCGQAVGGEREQCMAIALGVQRHSIATALQSHHITSHRRKEDLGQIDFTRSGEGDRTRGVTCVRVCCGMCPLWSSMLSVRSASPSSRVVVSCPSLSLCLHSCSTQ